MTLDHAPYDALLSAFLTQATESLQGLEIDNRTPLSRSDIRSLLLEAQWSVLSRIVSEHNNHNTQQTPVTVEELQKQLKNLNQTEEGQRQELLRLSTVMNEAARSTFARLVLFSGACLETRQQQQQRQQQPGEMTRKDIVEYCALAQSVLGLEFVQRHLRDGDALFPQLNDTANHHNSKTISTASLPPQRLKQIQSFLFRAMGYDPVFGHQELERLFVALTDNHDTAEQEEHEYARDAQVVSAVSDMVSAMQEAVARASTPVTLSDQNQGGVTRVVAVHHAEVDAETGQVLSSSSAPTSQSMMMHQQENDGANDPKRQSQQQQRQNQMHVAAASLQQDILEELQNMTEQERNVKLAQARHATQQFLQEAAAKPTAPERIEYLQSIDAETQRLMIMQKLWESASTAETEA